MADPSSSARTSVWMHIGRVVVAAALLWLALRGVDLAQLGRLVAQPSWNCITGVLALVVIDRALMAWRWIALVRVVEPYRSVPTRELVRVFFVSTFLGTLLPGSIGGDAVRALGASRLGLPSAVVVGSVAVDRLLGTVSVLFMAVVGLVFAGRVLDGRVLMVVALAPDFPIISLIPINQDGNTVNICKNCFNLICWTE